MLKIDFQDAVELCELLVKNGIMDYAGLKTWPDVKDFLRNVTQVPFYESEQSYYDYMSSDAWKQERERQICEHGASCEICGSTNNLNVHHISYKRGASPLDGDFAVLCRECHEKVHHVIDRTYAEDYGELRRIHFDWVNKAEEHLAERIAAKMNKEWPVGIPGKNKIRAVSIVRETFREQKSIQNPCVYPRHQVIAAKLIKRRK